MSVPIVENPMKILIINSRQVKNVGDRAIITCMIDQARSTFPGCEIVIASGEAADCRRYFPDVRVVPGVFDNEAAGEIQAAAAVRHLFPPGGSSIKTAGVRIFHAYLYAVASLRLRFGNELPAVLHEYRRADLILSAGGDFLSESYGTPVPILREIALAHQIGKPVVLYAQSVGPFFPKHLKYVRKILNKVSLIIARDRETVELLNGYRITAPIEQTADSVIPLSPQADAAALAARNGVGKRTIGFALISQSHSQIPESLYRSYLLGMRDLVNHAKSIGFEPLLLIASPMDLPATQEVAEMCGISMPIMNGWEQESGALKALLSEIRCIVSSRMHPIIIATSAGVPAIGIGKMFKMRNYLQMIGLEQYYLPLDNFNIDRARKMLEVVARDEGVIRLALRNNVRRVAALSERNMGLVRDRYRHGNA